ncbi:unnamed protein product [Ostreobium quekettii]|uniref:GATA-type domain-containing protein n=1 Tax=Ostreobium quekettii TaxID=121088 RepID=A0A8S1J764_9CHLO|nr:unnamed protein product [Ostreobium quekettii]
MGACGAAIYGPGILQFDHTPVGEHKGVRKWPTQVAVKARAGMQESFLQAVEVSDGQIMVNDDRTSEEMIKGKCTKCGTTRTPQWREGPEGPKTLCNACGVRLSREKKTKWGKATRRKKAQQQKNPPPCLRPSVHRRKPLVTSQPRVRVRASDVALITQLRNVLPIAAGAGAASPSEGDMDASKLLNRDINAAVQLLSMSFASKGAKRKVPGGKREGEVGKFEFMSRGKERCGGFPIDKGQVAWGAVPEARRAELWPMRAQLQTAWWQVEAAEAAVAAVAEVLAARTAAAMEAQLRYQDLTKLWEQAASSREPDDGQHCKWRKTEHAAQDV